MNRVLYAALLASAGVGQAQAATIVDTGPVPTTPSYNVYGGSAGGSGGFAGRFTLTVTTAISSIEFYGAALGLGNSGNIRADGTTPGASLYTGAIRETNNGISQWVGLTGLNWVLDAGSYWVTFESATGGDAIREATNFPNPVARQAEQRQNAWTTNPPYGYALRVQGDAVAAGVPEPASWAMLILGMGAIGGNLRQRRRTAVSFA